MAAHVSVRADSGHPTPRRTERRTQEARTRLVQDVAENAIRRRRLVPAGHGSRRCPLRYCRHPVRWILTAASQSASSAVCIHRIHGPEDARIVAAGNPNTEKKERQAHWNPGRIAARHTKSGRNMNQECAAVDGGRQGV